MTIILRRRIEIRGRIAKSMLSNCSTKWAKACDKRSSRLTSYIHCTCDYKQYCFSSNTAKQCRLGLFQDSDFAGDLEDSKSMCKKQTSVSYSSTESEIISLDAGLRMDGIPALVFWDLIVAVLHGYTNQSKQVLGDPKKSPTRKQIHGKTGGLNNVDFVSSNANSSRQEALLYVSTKQ